MNIYEVLQEVMQAPYTHVSPETASYYTRRAGGVLYIYFEWSNGKTDWKNNLDFPAKPYRDMKDKWYVHRGFLRVWKALEPYIQKEISDPSVRYIRIAGYSHGAALALLCHEYCVYHLPVMAKREHIVGIGFGCPRVVWGRLRRRIARRFENFYVIRNGRDLVTRVPPRWLGFRHVGKMIEIGQDKGYTPIGAHYAEAYIKELRERERKFMEEDTSGT